jgi:hypothetical protein
VILVLFSSALPNKSTPETRADLELLDTGLAPHYDVSHTDPNFLIEKFVQCPHYLVRNPYFEPAEGD